MNELSVALITIAVSCIVFLLYTKRRKRGAKQRLDSVDGGDAKAIPPLPEPRTLLGGHISWVREQVKRSGGLKFAAHVAAHEKHGLSVFALYLGPYGFSERACIVTDAHLAASIVESESVTVSAQISDVVRYMIGQHTLFTQSGDAWKRHRRLMHCVLTPEHEAFCASTATQVMRTEMMNIVTSCVEQRQANSAASQQQSRSPTIQSAEVHAIVQRLVAAVLSRTFFSLDFAAGGGSEFDALLSNFVDCFNRLAITPSLSLWKLMNLSESRRYSTARKEVTAALQTMISNKLAAAAKDALSASKNRSNGSSGSNGSSSSTNVSSDIKDASSASKDDLSTGKDDSPLGGAESPAKSMDLLWLLLNAEDDGYERMMVDGKRTGGKDRPVRKSKPPQSVRFTPDEALEEVLMMYVVAFNTLSCTMSWVLYYLAKDPNLQSLVYKEVTAVIGNCERPTVSMYDDLTFTKMVVMETLRLRPAAPLLARSVQSDVVIGGYQFLKGDHVLLSSYLVHRNERYWDDAEDFNVTRWTQAATLRSSGSFDIRGYMAFGLGNRSCPAEQSAMTQLLALLAAWVRKWRMYMAKKEIGERVGFTYSPGKLYLHLEPRDVSEDFRRETSTFGRKVVVRE